MEFSVQRGVGGKGKGRKEVNEKEYSTGTVHVQGVLT
jgi:hypothetical protein